MRTIIFKTENGLIHSKALIFMEVEKAMLNLKNGSHEISFNKPKRNVDQNALMWAWFNCLSRETGMEPKDFYKHFSEMFLSHNCTYNSGGEFLSGGTSLLNTKQFAEFLTKVQAQSATEFKCILPSPVDHAFLEFMNEYDMSNYSRDGE